MGTALGIVRSAASNKRTAAGQTIGTAKPGAAPAHRVAAFATTAEHRRSLQTNSAPVAAAMAVVSTTGASAASTVTVASTVPVASMAVGLATLLVAAPGMLGALGCSGKAIDRKAEGVAASSR